MSALKPPTTLEIVSGSLPTELALTTVATIASGGGVLAPLLPVLAASLASQRHRGRVEEALVEIQATLEAHSDVIKNISDGQYQLINETVLALLRATSTEKIQLLKSAVKNTINIAPMLSQEVVVLGRIIRDISAEEADFLVKHFGFDRVQLASSTTDYEQKVLTVHPDSPDGLIVVGLVSLGLLTAAEPTFDDSGLLRFAPITAKFLALIKSP